MPWVGFEPTIPVLEWAKTFHASDGVATVIGNIPTHSTYFNINIYIYTNIEIFMNMDKPNWLICPKKYLLFIIETNINLTRNNNSNEAI
jgi:hypothetical protein